MNRHTYKITREIIKTTVKEQTPFKKKKKITIENNQYVFLIY